MKFYLGTMSAGWLTKSPVPLFLNRRAMPKKRFSEATTDWALDSGGYSELHKNGEWSITTREYAAEIRRYQEHVGRLDWAAPMDWMCEPSVRAKTGLSVREHQLRTIRNFLDLRERVGATVVPVLQGWMFSDYEECVERYDRAGVDLWNEPVIGVGSVCRRSADTDIGLILRRLGGDLGLNLHAFGVRGKALRAHAEVLVSADSMAWSYRARAARQPGPNAKYEVAGRWCCGQGTNCAGCIQYALRWRTRLLTPLAQLHLPIVQQERAAA